MKSDRGLQLIPDSDSKKLHDDFGITEFAKNCCTCEHYCWQDDNNGYCSLLLALLKQQRSGLSVGQLKDLAGVWEEHICPRWLINCERVHGIYDYVLGYTRNRGSNK